MSALARYYTAWVVNLVVFAGFLLTKAIALGAIAAVTLSYAYLVRCPSCGNRLVKNRRRWTDGFALLPAKICLKCGHDLAKP